MPSPFPGLDPYLEQYWGDVHTSLTTYARNQLQPQLPADLKARVEEHVTVGERRLGRRVAPAVRVIERNRAREDAAVATATMQVAEPVIVPSSTFSSFTTVPTTTAVMLATLITRSIRSRGCRTTTSIGPASYSAERG